MTTTDHDDLIAYNAERNEKWRREDEAARVRLAALIARAENVTTISDVGAVLAGLIGMIRDETLNEVP